jgi:hypothetical protein
MRKGISVVLCLGLALAGCSRTPNNVEASSSSPSPEASTRAPLNLDAGTSFRVRMQETLDTRNNRSGDRFTAVLDEPLVSGDRVVVPKGTLFHGHVTESAPSGRFKGRAVMSLTLDSFTMNGHTHDIRSTSYARASKGHKKHHLLWIGGGSGGGALIGAAAGGGVGAAIGAGAGAAAGTVGSAITGKRQVRIPVESTVRFTLKDSVSL